MTDIEISLDEGHGKPVKNIRDVFPGLSREENTVLQVLYGNGSVSGADLFIRSESKPKILHVAVKTLRQRGYIRIHKLHGRPYIRLTASGYSACERIPA